MAKKEDIKQYLETANAWFEANGWKAFPFQIQAWNSYWKRENGIVNAPTGSGKTLSILMAVLAENYHQENPIPGTKLIWITPIRALSKEIEKSAKRAIEDLDMDWEVGVRTGDTSSKDRAKQIDTPPEILITTPESLHLLISTDGYKKRFQSLQCIVVDEWHDLLGTKRGVQMELALSRLRHVVPKLSVWGISATIGNMNEALDVLLGVYKQKKVIIKSDLIKEIAIETVFPDEIETLPWSGHLGISLLDKVIPILRNSNSTLLFTNTRSQTEIWYQKILEAAPELAGQMAMHHGSISRDIRNWVEEELHKGKLKAVICTSSLDLGVDFRPVETIIQVGSPKGVARFMQRAGRSGHQPGAVSRIYCVPTHSMELMEFSALRKAYKEKILEDRIPYIRSFDVLLQYLMTLAVSGGFRSQEIFEEIKTTYCFSSITEDEWLWLLGFLSTGGKTLKAYDEYKKLGSVKGEYRVMNKKVAVRHKLSIGTIVSDAMVNIKYVSGKKIGTVEEWFIGQLNPGDNFWFGGRSLEYVRMKGMDALVRKSKKKTGRIPSWLGGRIPMSSPVANGMRGLISDFKKGIIEDEEMRELSPLLELQTLRSALPKSTELLIEKFQSSEGFHIFMYPFEGRFVHEGMGSLLAKRISKIKPITFSIAMNDYGFELLSDQEIPLEEALEMDLFSVKGLNADIQASVNAIELGRRKFREIARISGLIFDGYPNKKKRDRHLQSSAGLLFDVFHEYEPNNLLYLQTIDEVMHFQLEEIRMRKALERIASQKIIIKQVRQVSPFSFPILVDRLREKLSSEQLSTRMSKMRLQTFE